MWKTSTLQVMLQHILTGTQESLLVLSITIRQFIKDQLLVSTWPAKNSLLTIFLSSGQDSSTTPWFSQELIEDGMMFILSVTWHKWNSWPTTSENLTTKLSELQQWIVWTQSKWWTKLWKMEWCQVLLLSRTQDSFYKIYWIRSRRKIPNVPAAQCVND